MRTFFISLCLAAALLCPVTLSAQLNKAYFFYVGRGLLIDNRYQEAIETLNILLKVDSKAYEGYFLRGIAKYNLDDLLGSESDFSKAIEINPVFTTAYQYRALTRMRLGNYDDALRDFQEAIDLRPDLPGAYYTRGLTYMMSQQYEKAIADFDRFIKQENKVADAYINRGTCYLHLKDTVRAYENYDQAIRTNREYPEGYNRRGALYLAEERNEEALQDFDKAVQCDTTYIASYFNRAVAYNQLRKPARALEDFDRAIALDSTNSLAYFNRALIRVQIGDYNRALDDFDRVALYSPDNVLVYFNRALLLTRLGEIEKAVRDYDRAIELYPDFANAYLGRAELKYLLKDTKGAKRDQSTAERKIAEYRMRLSDSTRSIYADTSRRFNRLLSFDTKFDGTDRNPAQAESTITLLPLYKFTLTTPDSVKLDPARYYLPRMEAFRDEFDDPRLNLTVKESDMAADSLVALDKTLAEHIARDNGSDWHTLFLRGITQSLIRQYTDAINTYSEAIALNPTNPFLYFNRSTTQAEMIDFISSMDNSFHRISLENQPGRQPDHYPKRTYNYDEAIADLNKVAKLYPDFAYTYYNRANMLALSGRLPEAYDDYSTAIRLHPGFAEAYYNRGLVQIYMKDTKKGCLDISKAGELGIREAYDVLRRYAALEHP